MQVFAVAALAVLMISLTVLIHYETLNATSRLIPHLAIHQRSRILVVIAGIFVAHVLEIWLFAVGYYAMTEHLELGSLAGEIRGDWLDIFYFSAACYTTLGVGDIIPTGPIRIVAGLESLTGFVLIGWSASFTFLTMQKFWAND
jgi:hypothetical protein